MVFSPKSKKYHNINFQLKFKDGTLIEKVKEYKYLGLIIDEELNWKPHIKSLKSKLSQSLGILYKLRHLTNKRVLYTIFQSLFMSRLNYGILCWARAKNSVLQPLKILLNKALRCINFCNFRDPVRHLLYRDKILQIDELFKLELGKFMHNFTSGKLLRNFDNYFLQIKTKHYHNTRNSQSNYFLPRKNSTKGLVGLNYLGPRLWSEIPESIKIKKSITSFTSLYKASLLATYD